MLLNTLMDLLKELTKAPVFKGIASETILDLTRMAEKISLEKEQILFRQGDPADSFYIILSGKVLAILESTNKAQVVTDIAIGDIIGEVTLLSSDTRSMTVKSVMPTQLLKISKKNMTKFCLGNPQVLINIINILASRSKHTLDLLAKIKKNRYIALIKLGDVGQYADFFERLIKNLITYEKNISTVEKPSTETAAISDYHNFTSYLDSKLNHEKDVFHELDLKQEFFSQCFIESSDEEVIFVLANSNVHVLDEYNRISNIKKRKKNIQRSLVLLYTDKQNSKPKNTCRWSQVGEFTAYYHVRINNLADVQRLTRFLLKRANGLVISGGAARSIIGIGAIKAILERNIPIDAVGGTSMGAIITGLLALNNDYTTFERHCIKGLKSIEHWNTMWDLTWPLVSIYNGKKLTNELQRLCGDVCLEDLWIPCFNIACNYSDSTQAIHSQGSMWQTLRASMAVPGLVPPCVIDGKLYIDGGLINNFPTDVMRDMVGEKGLIIGVNAFTANEIPKEYKLPPNFSFIDSFLTAIHLRNKEYVYPTLFEILTKPLFISSAERQNFNSQYADIHINPDLRNYRFFDFNRYQEMINLGYQEMNKELDNKFMDVNY